MVEVKHVIFVTLERCVTQLPSSSHHPNSATQKRLSMLLREVAVLLMAQNAKVSLRVGRYCDLKAPIHIVISYKHAYRRITGSTIHQS